MVSQPPTPPAPAAADERRSSIRKRLKTDVTFCSEGKTVVETDVDVDTGSNFYWGLIDDISEGGVFVATDYLPKRGTNISLRFSLPDGGEPISVTGEVRWFREESSRESPAGFGIHFVDLDDHAKTRIGKFLKQRDPLFYDD